MPAKFFDLSPDVADPVDHLVNGAQHVACLQRECNFFLKRSRDGRDARVGQNAHRLNLRFPGYRYHHLVYARSNHGPRAITGKTTAHPPARSPNRGSGIVAQIPYEPIYAGFPGAVIGSDGVAGSVHDRYFHRAFPSMMSLCRSWFGFVPMFGWHTDRRLQAVDVGATAHRRQRVALAAPVLHAAVKMAQKKYFVDGEEMETRKRDLRRHLFDGPDVAQQEQAAAMRGESEIMFRFREDDVPYGHGGKFDGKLLPGVAIVMG